jgi:hypothetical protein
MILHGLDVVHLAPNLGNADAEVGGQVIEPHLLELKSGVGNGLQGGFQCLEVAAQDVRPWGMLWGFSGLQAMCRTETFTRCPRWGGGAKCHAVSRCGILRDFRRRSLRLRRAGAPLRRRSCSTTLFPCRAPAAQSTRRRKREKWPQAIGRSRRSHIERPLSRRRSRQTSCDRADPGNIADISMGVPLPTDSAPTKRLIADKATMLRACADGSTPDGLRLSSLRPQPTPLLTRWIVGPTPVVMLSNGCSAVSRIGGRIVTRYDRLASSYIAAIALIAIAKE